MSRRKCLTDELFSINISIMETQLRFLKEKLGTWKKVAGLLDITERYCLMILKSGHAGKHLSRIINQKVSSQGTPRRRFMQNWGDLFL